MSDNQIIAFADKTVLKISGLSVRGLDTRALEQRLTEKLGSIVRVIGVTGSSIDMDVYGLTPEQLLRDEGGILRTVSTTEGVSATEVAKLSGAEHIVPVDINDIGQAQNYSCARERWVRHD